MATPSQPTLQSFTRGHHRHTLTIPFRALTRVWDGQNQLKHRDTRSLLKIYCLNRQYRTHRQAPVIHLGSVLQTQQGILSQVDQEE